MKKALLFGGLKILGFGFLLMPHSLRLLLAKAIARLLFWLDTKRIHDICANLDFAYEHQLTKAQKQRIIDANYLHLVYNVMAFFMLGVMSKKTFLKQLRIHNLDILIQARQTKRPIVFISAHYGNWEYIAPSFCCLFDEPITAIARLTPYKLVNDYLCYVRERFGVKILDKKGAFPPLIQTIKAHQPIGIIIDQNTTNAEGILVEFFKKKVRHSQVASLLSLKYNAILIPAIASYSKDYKTQHIMLYPPLIPASQSSKEIQSLTQMQSDFLESIIKTNPAQWLWFHKKFKNQYPSIYQ